MHWLLSLSGLIWISGIKQNAGDIKQNANPYENFSLELFKVAYGIQLL